MQSDYQFSDRANSFLKDRFTLKELITYSVSSYFQKGGARRSSINSSKGRSQTGITQPLSEEKKGFTEANSERAAVTIQTQYRRYQQRKNEGRNS
ncbi:uncharacterized protein LOC119954159 isoform X3 [Scyliorhinus canicula]|uniref:uncharacterized protein LOC119954159 isoform X3 n=1 Tax=Scyliorhinus canicula TaxID=7830 RepID=UPI0018F6C724|nr:uncharacterized protein LOC119954159 isoform X3 [Scyliorhinus canicula]